MGFEERFVDVGPAFPADPQTPETVQSRGDPHVYRQQSDEVGGQCGLRVLGMPRPRPTASGNQGRCGRPFSWRDLAAAWGDDCCACRADGAGRAVDVVPAGGARRRRSALRVEGTGGEGTARCWLPSSSWPPQAAPGINCHQASGCRGCRPSAGSPSGRRPGCGPSSTAWSWTNSAWPAA